MPVPAPPSRSLLPAEWVAAAVAMICYLNVLPNDFCYDDDAIVRLNERVNEPGHWRTVWTTDYWSHIRNEWPNRDLLYRPVALTSYRLVRMIAGPHPFLQHLVNVVLHALVAALLVRLCRRCALSDTVCLAAGLLFAVHPIHSEVVAGVVGRADILATLGVLLALLAHRRSLHAGTQLSKAGWRFAAALAAFGAMGAKENGVTVLPVVVLWDAFAARSAPTSDGGHWWSWKTLRRLMYLLVPAALYFALRYYALDGHLYQRPALTKTVNVLVDAPQWQHALGILQLWGMYWAQMFWPGVLCINYSINSVRLATSPLDPHVLLGSLLTVGLIAVAVAAWRKNSRTVAFLATAIVVSYAPTANAFVLIQVFFAERVWYLPSIWAAVLIALMTAPLLRMRFTRTIGIILLLALAARGWIRNSEWRDNGTLYAAAYRDHPDAVGCLQLYGQWLVNNDEYALGAQLLERAIDIDMGYTDAHRTLGLAHLRAGRWPGAVNHLQIAEMQAPGHPATAAGLERASRKLAESQGDEITRLKQAAENDPTNVEAEIALIQKLRELGQIRAATDRLLAGESQFSGNALWQGEYAVTLVFLNDRDGAIVRYRRSLELAPNEPQRIVELTMLLLERRQGDDLDRAWELSMQASALAPSAPSVLICRAELLALRGDMKGAVAAYQEAIQSLPPGSDRRQALEQRAKAIGRQ